MNIFFDVDYTLIAMDGSLRPGVVEAFQQIRKQGHRVYVWSGVGIRWDVVRYHGLAPYVSGCYLKPLEDFEAVVKGMEVQPDLVVDDHRGIVDALGGIVVEPYILPNAKDREMDRVRQAVIAMNRDGNSHVSFEGA